MLKLSPKMRIPSAGPSEARPEAPCEKSANPTPWVAYAVVAVTLLIPALLRAA